MKLTGMATKNEADNDDLLILETVCPKCKCHIIIPDLNDTRWKSVFIEPVSDHYFKCNHCKKVSHFYDFNI